MLSDVLMGNSPTGQGPMEKTECFEHAGCLWATFSTVQYGLLSDFPGGSNKICRNGTYGPDNRDGLSVLLESSLHHSKSLGCFFSDVACRYNDIQFVPSPSLTTRLSVCHSGANNFSQPDFGADYGND